MYLYSLTFDLDILILNISSIYVVNDVYVLLSKLFNKSNMNLWYNKLDFNVAIISTYDDLILVLY